MNNFIVILYGYSFLHIFMHGFLGAPIDRYAMPATITTYVAIIIEICGHKFTEKEQDTIKRVIKDYFGLKLGDKIIDLDKEAGITTVQGNGFGSDNSVYFHVGANTDQVINTTFSDMRAHALGLTGTGEAFTKEYTVNNGTDSNPTERGLNISTRETANMSIDITYGKFPAFVWIEDKNIVNIGNFRDIDDNLNLTE